MPDQVIAGLILAAGDSSRLGQPKADVAIGGVTFLEAVVRKMASVGVSRICASVSLSHDKIRNYNALGISTIVVPEQYRNLGPIESLRAWLLQEFNQTVDMLVVWPVDQPHVAAKTVETILASAVRAPSRLVILPSWQGKRGHPVIFRRAILGELLSPIADKGAREVVRRDPSRVLEVPVDDHAVVQDVDTPEDLSSLISSRESLF